MQVLEIDNTKRSSYATCPRKFFFRSIKHLTSKYGSSALRFGSTWHALMEGFYGSIIENGWDYDHTNAAIELAREVWIKESEKFEFYEDYRTFDNACISFVQYLEEFKLDNQMMNIKATERMFRIRVVLTEEEKKLYPYLADTELYFTGKLDLEVELSGQDWLQEFKTTGQPIQTQADRLQRSAQILGYTWATRQLGSDVVGTLVSIHQLLARKVKAGGYGKVTRNFLRQPNIFTQADLDSWRQSFLYTSNQIAFATLNNHFPCQYDSCYQFGKCGYTTLCEQNRPYDELHIDGFVKEEWNVLKSGGSKQEPVIVEG